MKLTTSLVLLGLLSACATVTREEPVEYLGEAEGYVALSTGRNRQACENCGGNIFGILPFIYWRLYSESFEPTEIIFKPQYLALGELDVDDYGYSHVKEVAAGNYFLLGFSREGLITECFKFTVDPGVINYLGEFLTVQGGGSERSILHSKKQARDMRNIYQRYPYLQEIPVVGSVINKKICRVTT